MFVGCQEPQEPNYGRVTIIGHTDWDLMHGRDVIGSGVDTIVQAPDGKRYRLKTYCGDVGSEFVVNLNKVREL